MGQQVRFKRQIAQIPFVAGQPASFELPKGYDYESLTLRLSGVLNVTVAGAAVRVEAPSQLIQRVEITSDGRNNNYSAPFWASCFGRHDLNPNSQQAKNIAVPPTAAAIAAYNLEATGVIHFATPDGERPKDSNLVTSNLTLFTLRLQFGQPIDVLTGAPTATFVGVVDVLSSEILEIPDADGTRTMPSALRKTTLLEQVAPAVTQNHEILLPAGNMVKSVLIRAEAATGEPALGIANMFTLSSVTDVRVQARALELRTENAHMFGWLKDGYYAIDITRNGPVAHLTEMWDLTKQSQPKLITDVTGGANIKLQALVTEYIRA